jgi:hypothetical protein
MDPIGTYLPSTDDDAPTTSDVRRYLETLRHRVLMLLGDASDGRLGETLHGLDLALGLESDAGMTE